MGCFSGHSACFFLTLISLKNLFWETQVLYNELVSLELTLYHCLKTSLRQSALKLFRVAALFALNLLPLGEVKGILTVCLKHS